MTEEEKEAIENTKKKIEATQKGLEEGKYYGERFSLEQNIKREQTLLNLIDKQQKEIQKLKRQLKVEIYARDMVVSLNSNLKQENEKLKQEIKDVTSIPEGDESYD